jgi:Holliday junction resolvase RusA-like endonuclease
METKKDYLSPRSESYTIPGNPIALARARYSEHRVYDSQKQLKLIIGIQLVNQHNNKPPFSGPISLNVRFYLPLPKRYSTTLPGSYHLYRPDLSNLIKLVEDVATGIIYKDDCIIAQIQSIKLYDRNPRTELTITTLPGKP